MVRFLSIFLSLCLLCGCENGPASSARQEPPAQPAQESAADTQRQTEAASWTYQVSDRPYYRFRAVEPDWTTDAAAMPPGFVEAAAKAVYEHYPAKSVRFTKGYLHDYDGDGRQEAVLLLFAPVDEMDWYHGDSHFVYVNADKEAQFLMSGCDLEGKDPPETVFDQTENKMQSKIIQYPGFTHLLVKSGTATMASGSYFTVYIPTDGRMEKGFSDFYPYYEETDVFFVSTGPQGMGPRHTFWNIETQTYCDVAGQDMPVDAFVQLIGEKALLEAIPENLSSEYDLGVENVCSVYVLGNAYYRVSFCETETDEPYGLGQMTLAHNADGTWDVISRSFMDYDVRVDEAHFVTDVDIAAARRSAIDTPVEN